MLYSLFLSNEQLKGYLTILKQNGLLEYLPLSRTYKTTEKGLKVLKLYEQDLTPITNNNGTIRESINEKSVWRITAGAPIIVMGVLSSLLSVVAQFT
jgi:hypothetical protein